MPCRILPIVALLVLASAATARAADVAPEPLRTGQAAFQDWRGDKPGVRRKISAADLPAPNLTPSASNSSKVAAQPQGAKPDVPQGFVADLVASGLGTPRVVRVAPNGDVFVADSWSDRVRVFRLAPGSVRIVQAGIFAGDLNEPYGIAFHPPGPQPQWIYVANTDGVVRFPYRNGDLTASGRAQTVIADIPGGGGHWTRDIAFSPDGKTLYLSVGSASNVAEGMKRDPPGGLTAWQAGQALGAAWGEEARRADVLAFDPDGRNQRIFATGLRNCAGMAIEPRSGAPWCVVNECDELGDNTPFDYATEVKPGAFYGWPWYYIGANEDPRHKGARPDLARTVTVPDVLIQAHSAPLNIVFHTGENFPADYKGDAFVTLHGSWNRGRRTGYKVVRLIFRDGRPTGEYQDFATGFVSSDAAAWGRPVGIAVGADGALLVTDDAGGTLWRIARAKPG